MTLEDPLHGCWYCACKMTATRRDRPFLQPKTKTREHLISRSLGGRPNEIVFACHRCNQFVGNAPVPRKRMFRNVIRHLGGWPEAWSLFDGDRLAAATALWSIVFGARRARALRFAISRVYRAANRHAQGDRQAASWGVLPGRIKRVLG